MDKLNLQTKIKSPTNLDVETADEATNLLKNGILIETNKGLICMSLNDALSSDLNISVDDLRNVAAQLISQQNVGSKKFLQTTLNFDSDGFSSECSDISTTTSGSGSGVQSYIISSISSDSTSNIFNCDNQIQNIFNRPKVFSVGSAGRESTEKINSSTFKDEKSDITIKTEETNMDFAIKTEETNADFTIKTEETNLDFTFKIQETDKGFKQKGKTTQKIQDILKLPSMNKSTLEPTKPKKGRGGWPKGRKRKPELLNLPPKAPATGYTLYLNEQRKLFKSSSLAFHEITKIIGNKWSSLTLEEKRPYLERGEEDKKRYREELKQYRHSDAYRAYLTKKRKKRLQNNVLSESDMDATDDFDEEDNEELYCRTCDQWFHNMHNKREHLQGKQHLQSVAGDITRELAFDKEVGTASTVSISTSLDESSLDGMPNLRNSTNSDQSIHVAMAKLTAMVSKRELEIKMLQNRQQEAVWQQQALSRQLLQLTERHKKLQKDLTSLHDKEKDMEDKVFHLWQVPSFFIITDLNVDSTTDFTESTE